MAGAMRRMGIYLGLVEDDDTRGYGRYDARQADYAEHPDDRRYDRYADEGYDGHYDDYDKGRYAPAGYAEPAYAEDRAQTGRPAAAREAEPASPRRGATGRPIGLAPAAGSAVAPAGPTAAVAAPVRAGGVAAGGAAGASAAGLAVREKPVAEVAPAPAVQPYRITTVHPRTYNEARTIGERYREGCPVIMNLTELDDADAKRLVDFAAGLIFGLRGSIERVTAKVFLLSPQDVDVTAEDKARIREGGFFNQS
jgi:FtsZ-interacting cell division protein YlmF